MKYALIIILLISASMQVHAQHDHMSAKKAKWEHTPLFQKAFSEASYAGMEVMVVNFVVPPGATDTVAHHHDCQLIGYVTEGEVITKMYGKDPLHLTKGQVFYEYPNEIHESLTNPNKKKRAVIILYYLYHTGSTLYTKEGEIK